MALSGANVVSWMDGRHGDLEERSDGQPEINARAYKLVSDCSHQPNFGIVRRAPVGILPAFKTVPFTC